MQIWESPKVSEDSYLSGNNHKKVDDPSLVEHEEIELSASGDKPMNKKTRK